MANTATKRGRPPKNVQNSNPAKTKESAPLLTEFELLSANGRVFMMGSGPTNWYDEKENRVRPIRYCKSEPSIFVEDQSSNPTKTPIIFEQGKLFVPREQPNLLDFLATHPSNEENGGNLFRKVDNTKEAKKDLDAEFLTVDAIALLRTRPLSDVMSVATALAVNVDRPVDEIKHDLLVFAKKDPKKFIESFDNPVVNTKAKVVKAMSMGVISHNGGHIVWTDTNRHIVAVPTGTDPEDVFTRYCMTEAGAPVLAEIERQL